MEVAVPIQSVNGRLLGVLAGRLNFQGIEQVLREQLKGHESVVIVQAGGQVVASAGGTFRPMPEATLRQLRRADTTVVSYQAADGLAVVGALSAVPRSDWSAVAEIPASTAFKDIRQLRVATAVAAGGPAGRRRLAGLRPGPADRPPARPAHARRQPRGRAAT